MKQERRRDWCVADDESSWACTKCRTRMRTCSQAPSLRDVALYWNAIVDEWAPKTGGHVCRRIGYGR